jgi:hypothetical protein
MADDKKPKIDLKSRLQKMGGAGGPSGAVAPVSKGIPVPSMPGAPVAGIPAPPGTGSTPAPPIDPNNPLAAVASPFRAAVSLGPQQAAPAAPPQPQRIEVDEGVVHEARSGARKQGLVLGVGIGIALGVVGWIGGGASANASATNKGRDDAKALAGDVSKARDTIKAIGDKIDEGRKTLVNEKKFPADLSKALSELNVDFDGTKLYGRRFTTTSPQTVKLLIDFISDVGNLKEKQTALQGYLNVHQKGVQEEIDNLALPAPPIGWVAVLDKNVAGNGTFVAPLEKPWKATKEQPNLPDKLTYVEPRSKNKVTDARFSGGAVEKLASEVVLPIVPQSMDKAFDSVCPGDQRNQRDAVIKQMQSVLSMIRTQEASEGVEEPKPGLLDKAEKLAAGLSSGS